MNEGTSAQPSHAENSASETEATPGVQHACYWSDEADEFVVVEASPSETRGDYMEGDGTLGEADRVVVFEGVTPERLLVLTRWASSELEEDTVGFTSAEGLDLHYVDGVAGVQQSQRQRTGDASGSWDIVP